jgi:hypothetical protein
LLGNMLVENNTASHPLDEAISADQHYLYILCAGSPATATPSGSGR